MAPTVHFFYQSPCPQLRNRTRLKKFIPRIFKKERKSQGTISVIFCTDEYLFNINKQYLNHSYYTDIITFSLAPQDKPINGELYISVDRVKDNAKTLKQSFKTEIHRVIFHGILHLCGHKDKLKSDSEKMRKAENDAIKQYFDKHCST